MAIDKKLIHFKTKENFMSANGVNGNDTTPSSGSEAEGNAEYGQIKGTSIVFIKDSNEIWTHGQLYKSVNWSVLIPPPPAALCDIAYWDGSKVKTVSQDEWNTSLGTPVGVVVIPEGMLPDGKARIIGLKSDGCQTWGTSDTDVSELTNYNKVPTTDNVGSTSTGSSSYGYLPSDGFTGATSFVDSTAKYNVSSNLIPSPYLGDNKTLNPEYSKEILSGDTNVNCLSDFNGLSNTEVLVGLGTDYEAAQYCWSYSDDSSNLQWYLPAAGELGFIMPRFNAINASITAVGGSSVSSGSSRCFWSSSEDSYNKAYSVCVRYGLVGSHTKSVNGYYVRPFAIID